FMKQDNSQRKALVLYLEGALNRGWDEAEKAIRFYLDASKEIEKTEDYQLAHLIYVGLGNIYLYRKLYKYAEDAFLESLEYAKQSGNNVYISTSLSLIARVYASLNNWEKSINSYKEAIDIGKKSNNAIALSLALSELSAVYTQTENYLLALECIQKAFDVKVEANLDIEESLLTKGRLYYLIGKSDSAYYYLQESLYVNNIYTRKTAYQILYDLSKANKDYFKAIEYGDKFQFYKDSIQKIDRSRALVEMQEKYNQEKVINEKNQLKIEKNRITRNLLIILIVLLIIIGILIFIYQYILIRKQRTIQKHQEEIKRYTLRIYENESQISRNESRINELIAAMEQNKDVQELLEEQQNAIIEIQNQNKNLLKENKDLQQNISHYSASLNKKTEELDALKALSEENKFLRDREKFLCAQLVKQTHTLNNLKTNAKFLEVLQWEEVFAAINLLYNNFTERLQKDIPSLTESEIQICCLIKLRLSIPDMATVLAISPTSVSKKKLRLKERITLRLGKVFEDNQSLDSWIWDY
ncbi:tetratricopeptide repeat protein, partial [Bacteroides sp. OttesenSCG-928-D19]|nr:tetratricopeptide repeat protein [Bacteroides sp. OttesenSCG-928-D19]